MQPEWPWYAAFPPLGGPYDTRHRHSFVASAAYRAELRSQVRGPKGYEVNQISGGRPRIIVALAISQAFYCRSALEPANNVTSPFFSNH
jgi:hypothetical protein